MGELMGASSIIANALAESELVTRSAISQAHYPSHKFNRIKVCYEKTVDLYGRAMAGSDADDFRPDAAAIAHLARAASVAKSRLSRLDYYVIIRRPELDEWYREVRDADAFEQFLGCPVPPSPPSKYNPVYGDAADRAARGQAEEWVFRIQEAFDRSKAPVFWTLTVDPDWEHIIAKGRTEFALWLRKVRRRFGDFEYCCVVERGEETGRLHYHCLFLFHDLQATDPNAYKAGGSRREIPEMRGFWPYGLSNPVAVRFNPADYYGSLGWRWPIGADTGNIEAVATYMAGYITQFKGDINGCRTKCTRKFGLKSLMWMTREQAASILLGDHEKIANQLPLKSKPPVSLMNRCAAKIIFGQSAPEALPEMRTGSVQEAAALFAREKSTRMSSGDLISRGDGFDGHLDTWRKENRSVQMGRTI